MAYRASIKRKQMNARWSKSALAKQERLRMSSEPEPLPIDTDQDEIEIIIKRKLTNEVAHFVCTRGTRIDNYMVYCNGTLFGIMGITKLCASIRKALPAFRSMG